MTDSPRHDHIFICENGSCLAQATLSITDEQYQSRFYFSPAMDCPVCARKMYETEFLKGDCKK
jgi:hypothetical protein